MSLYVLDKLFFIPFFRIHDRNKKYIYLNNLVQSIRGKSGGYILNKNAADIKISEVLIAVDEKVKTVGCEKHSKKGCNGKSAKCITHNLWDELEDHINNFFEKKKLSDLINKKDNRI